MAHERLMHSGSGSLELPRDGSTPATPPALPDPPSPPARPHHVVVSAHDRDLLDDPAAGSSPTLIRDPVDLEPRQGSADLGSSSTLIRDPIDLEFPAPDEGLARRWWPFLVAGLLLLVLVFTCGATPA